MRLFDCFTFFNELDLLELRLLELDRFVHRFVLVEAPQTFTGLPKPLHFKLNRDRFERFLPKIIHVELEEFPPGLASAWDREHLSRRGIMRGLTSAAPDDLVLISDVDEIPKPAILGTVLRSPGSARRLTVFESEGFMYYLNVRDTYETLVSSPRLVSMKYLRDPQAVRALKPRVSKHPIWSPIAEALAPIIGPLRSWSALGYPLPVHIERRAAWHFTGLGGATTVRDKLLAYSHTELATPERVDIDNIASSIERCQNIYTGADLAKVPMADLPAALRDNPDRWARYLLPETGRDFALQPVVTG